MPVRKARASSNSRGVPDSVRSPVTTISSGTGAPSSTSRVSSPQICACTSSARTAASFATRPWPKRVPPMCSTPSSVRGAVGRAATARG
jgi:hypothetical protein